MVHQPVGKLGGESRKASCRAEGGGRSRSTALPPRIASGQNPESGGEVAGPVREVRGAAPHSGEEQYGGVRAAPPPLGRQVP
ncbi:hypothetical protein GCM10009753_68010 [Streptantibioticus ferralitis]